MSSLILASSSSSRKELLQRLGHPFEVNPPSLDEQPYKERLTCPEELASTLARAKALEVFEKLTTNTQEKAIVIGSDQVAHLKRRYLEQTP